MAKKENQVNEIVENEPVAINKNDIVSGEKLQETDVIDVKAPEVIIEEEAKAKTEAEEKAKAEAEEKAKKEAEEKAKAEAEEKAKKEAEEKAKTEAVKLKVLIAFTDKYTKQDYIAGDIISVSKERATELLADPRRLVEKVD